MRQFWQAAVLCLTAALAAVLLTGAATSAQTVPPAGPYYLVSLERGVAPSAAKALFWDAGLHVVEQLQPLPVYRVTATPAMRGADPLEALRGVPAVLSMEVEGEQAIQVVPSDSMYRQYQWNLRRIGMEQAWNLRPSAPEIVVAVLDTGVDLEHPDLRANLLLDQGYNFINDTPNPQDDESHGTAVAGIIGAVGNNREGMAGIAWRIKILPLKALNEVGRGPDSAMVKAILYAADQGADIINISSTGTRYSAALQQAVEYAQDKGALLIAAAGNTGDRENEMTYPAAFAGVLAVAAVDEQDQVAEFSQRHPYVAIAAPGVDVASTSWPGAGRGPYAAQSGTSIAAPHVSGVAALLWTMRPDFSADDIAQILIQTADDPGAEPDAGYGAGILDAARAVAAARLGVPPRGGVVSTADALPVAGTPGVPAAAAAPTTGAQAPAVPLPTPPPDFQRGRQWYFAEGSTNPPFEMRFAIQNPNPTPARVRFTFLSPTGAQTPHELVVGANGRATLDAASVMPDAEFGTIAQSDLPVYVERTMFFGHDGHTSSGARAPARTWYLAEGSSVEPFDTWILLMNPNGVPATARLLYTPENGPAVEQTVLVPPRGRASVYANLALSANGFATRVEADQPIVVERAMYVDGGEGGDDVLGTTTPGRTWYIAQGSSRGGMDTWLLVQNPGMQPASAMVTFYRDDGRTATQPLLIPPQRRVSLYTNMVVPDSVYGMKLESDQPVVLERAQYLEDGNGSFDTTGVAAPATEWFMPEGQTEGAFTEQLSVLNPQSQPARVQIDFRRQDNVATPSRAFTVGPNRQVVVDINPFVPDAIVALHVTSDRPIVAERTLYFARTTGTGATSSSGLAR